YFLAETNLTGERPFHTRIHKSPGHNAEAQHPTTQTGEGSEISAIENGKIRVGAIPAQRISGQYRVIHAMRKAVTRHGSRFWRCL
ncbi:hypothetical protein, partial [Bifidobacterium reuteri]|uniref:hypothetical protein n=1 Tax=Bifidobacterium reuteri TaxID=983706 RepID=UPI001EE75D70